jgi:hypothetical protein
MLEIHVFSFERHIYRDDARLSVVALSHPSTLEDVRAPGYDRCWDLDAVSALRRAAERDAEIVVLTSRVAGKYNVEKIERLIEEHLDVKDVHVLTRPYSALSGDEWEQEALKQFLFRRQKENKTPFGHVKWLPYKPDVALRASAFSGTAAAT